MKKKEETPNKGMEIFRAMIWKRLDEKPEEQWNDEDRLCAERLKYTRK